MTNIQRTINDRTTRSNRRTTDKIIRDNRVRNDDLTKERRLKADKTMNDHRLKNDEITADRRHIKDRNLNMGLALFLVVFTTLAIGAFYVFI